MSLHCSDEKMIGLWHLVSSCKWPWTKGNIGPWISIYFAPSPSKKKPLEQGQDMNLALISHTWNSGFWDVWYCEQMTMDDCHTNTGSGELKIGFTKNVGLGYPKKKNNKQQKTLFLGLKDHHCYYWNIYRCFWVGFLKNLKVE